MTDDDSNFWGFALIAWVILSWITHIVVCIQQAKWILLLVGAFVFPVGCVHGTGVWFDIF